MPTPHSHTWSSGKVTWKVRFRYEGHATSATFDTEPEAWRFCRLIQGVGIDQAVEWLKHHNEADPDSPTLDAWMDRYISSRTSITEGTRVDYVRVYRRTWHPRIGSVQIAILSRERIAQALNDLRDAYSDKSVKNAWGILAGAMRQAYLDRLIERNPCDGITLPRQTRRTVRPRFLTHAEVGRIDDHLPDHWKPLVAFLVGTGARWGEAEALTVADVDLTSELPVVRIDKAAKWTGRSQRKVGPPKTARSERTISLPDQLVHILRPLVADRAGDEPLFTTPSGDAITHKYFWDHVWRPAVAAADLKPPPRIHDLRHTHVAWMISLGAGLPLVQARLGHESIKTTVDTYGGLLPDVHVQAAHIATRALAQVPSLPVAGELVEE